MPYTREQSVSSIAAVHLLEGFPGGFAFTLAESQIRAIELKIEQNRQYALNAQDLEDRKWFIDEAERLSSLLTGVPVKK